MKNYDRIFVIVLDSLGIGAMPDSAKFGDIGVDTFGLFLRKWVLWRFQILENWEC